MDSETSALSEAVKVGDHPQAVRLVKEALSRGVPAGEILEQGLVAGVRALGDLFREGQVFLPEVLISTRAMNLGLAELKPYLRDADVSHKGTVVLGTVEGDLHDIGKNLVKMMLEGNGYHVVDLGVDVGTQAFLQAAKNHAAEIVAMSGLLTTTMPYFSTVAETLREAGLRDKVKIMVGGAPITRAFADEIDAEGFAPDCVTAVDEADRLMTSR
jgi:corrinoid protein of di/trimethylamine methyltransferase